MHVMAVGGVINVCLFLCLRAFAAAGCGWDVVRGYVELWFWPRGNPAPTSVLKEKRVESDKKAKRIKCQASEIIGLLPVIALFAQLVLLPQGTAVGACHVLLALANVLDLLVASPSGGC